MYCFVSVIDGCGIGSLVTEGILKSNDPNDFLGVESECGAHAFLAYLYCAFPDEQFVIQYIEV